MCTERDTESKSKNFMPAIFMMFLLAAITLTGCSSSGDKASSMNEASMGAQTETLAAADRATSNGNGDQQKAESGTEAKKAADIERKLIYNADVVMEVKSYDTVKKNVDALIDRMNGYTVKFEDQQSEYERGGTYTVRVPASKFQSALDELEKLSHERFERNYSTTDVTEEYIDLESRLKAKRLVESRLIGYMETAKDAGDLLEFSNKLSQVQEEIEGILGKVRYIDTHVAMSTIQLRVYEEVKEDPSKDLEKAFGERMGLTLYQSLNALLTFVQVLILFIIALLPFAILAAVITLPIIWLVRKRKRARVARERADEVHPFSENESEDKLT